MNIEVNRNKMAGACLIQSGHLPQTYNTCQFVGLERQPPYWKVMGVNLAI